MQKRCTPNPDSQNIVKYQLIVRISIGKIPAKLHLYPNLLHKIYVIKQQKTKNHACTNCSWDSSSTSTATVDSCRSLANQVFLLLPVQPTYQVLLKPYGSRIILVPKDYDRYNNAGYMRMSYQNGKWMLSNPSKTRTQDL